MSFINKIRNKFHSYEKFSKIVLQKHASKINKMRTETIALYVNKVKKDILRFSGEVRSLTGDM